MCLAVISKYYFMNVKGTVLEDAARGGDPATELRLNSRKPCSLRSTSSAVAMLRLCQPTVTALIIGHRRCRHNVEQIFAASSAFAALLRDGALLQFARTQSCFGVIAFCLTAGSVVAWGEAKNGGDCSFLASQC